MAEKWSFPYDGRESTPVPLFIDGKGVCISNSSAEYAAIASGANFPFGEAPPLPALRRQLNAIKRQEFPWMLEVTKNAPQMAIKNLGQPFKKFFIWWCNALPPAVSHLFFRILLPVLKTTI